jgi:taspase (threonine aspartase 1)
VVVDGAGRVAAGVSSGGIAVKREGRVGEAAAFGAGCWAQRSSGQSSSTAVACSVTGVGERVMRHLVAREAALAVMRAPAREAAGASCTAVLQRTVLQASRRAGGGSRLLAKPRGSVRRPAPLGMQDPPPNDCGILCVRAVRGPARAGGGTAVRVELGVAHCSQSMAVAYQGHQNSQARVRFLRRKEGAPARELTAGVHWAAAQDF